MRSLPVSWLPLVGLLALPFVVAFAVALEPVAALAAVNTVLIVVTVRLLFGSRDLDRLGRGGERVQ